MNTKHSRTRSRLSADRFLFAAELMSGATDGTDGRADTLGCCYAISQATLIQAQQCVEYDSKYHDFFAAVFPPSIWFGTYNKHNRKRRTQALLLCAELVRRNFTAKDFK